MSWECSFSRHVPRLAILPQASKADYETMIRRFNTSLHDARLRQRQIRFAARASYVGRDASSNCKLCLPVMSPIGS